MTLASIGFNILTRNQTAQFDIHGLEKKVKVTHFYTSQFMVVKHDAMFDYPGFHIWRYIGRKQKYSMLFVMLSLNFRLIQNLSVSEAKVPSAMALVPMFAKIKRKVNQPKTTFLIKLP